MDPVQHERGHALQRARERIEFVRRCRKPAVMFAIFAPSPSPIPMLQTRAHPPRLQRGPKPSSCFVPALPTHRRNPMPRRCEVTSIAQTSGASLRG